MISYQTSCGHYDWALLWSSSVSSGDFCVQGMLLMSFHSWSFCLGLRNVYIIIPNRCSKWMNIVWQLCIDYYLCIMCKLVITKYEISLANSCRLSANTWPYFSCMCSFLCILFDSFCTRLSFIVLLNPLIFTILSFPIMPAFLSLVFLRRFFSLFPLSPPSFHVDVITKAGFLHFHYVVWDSLIVIGHCFCRKCDGTADWSVAGLTRPPMYPFSTGQYPYPMLSPEMSQVAASW